MRYSIIAITAFVLGLLVSLLFVRPQVGWLTTDYVPADQEIVLAQYDGMQFPIIACFFARGVNDEPMWIEANNFEAGRHLPEPKIWRRIK